MTNNQQSVDILRAAAQAAGIPPPPPRGGSTPTPWALVCRVAWLWSALAGWWLARHGVPVECRVGSRIDLILVPLRESLAEGYSPDLPGLLYRLALALGAAILLVGAWSIVARWRDRFFKDKKA